MLAGRGLRSPLGLAASIYRPFMAPLFRAPVSKQPLQIALEITWFW